MYVENSEGLTSSHFRFFFLIARKSAQLSVSSTFADDAEEEFDVAVVAFPRRAATPSNRVRGAVDGLRERAMLVARRSEFMDCLHAAMTAMALELTATGTPFGLRETTLF